MRTVACLLAITIVGALAARAESPGTEVRAVLTAHQDGMSDRNVAHVQKTVANDLVVIREGVRFDGWQQYRDRRLVREFTRPAPAARWEVVKLNASADIAWAYTKTLVARGKEESTVWTAFVFERRGKEWKIVLIDESIGRSQLVPRRH